MARQDYTPFLLFGLIAILLVVFFSRGSTVVVQDSPIKFSSVRKHPFDVYADPYHPPSRENPYIGSPGYHQVGVLKNNQTLLPLFGRPSPYSSSKWEYYTMSNGLKLPVAHKDKPCDSDTGCEELLDGNADKVDVMGLGHFKSMVYGVKQLRY